MSIENKEDKKMAKYDVRFSCGHTERKELFGAEKDRQSKIAYWEKSGVCSECYRKEKEQEAVRFAQENALPKLEGSEKQIAWATEIRLRKLAELEQMMEEALAEMPGEKELIEAQGQEYKAKLLKITKAATWIDARKSSVDHIISTVCRSLGI